MSDLKALLSKNENISAFLAEIDINKLSRKQLIELIELTNPIVDKPERKIDIYQPNSLSIKKFHQSDKQNV